MAATCSHKDETRQGVSSTAHLVASFRALEKDLFIDPYADLLGGTIGREFIEKMKNEENGEQKFQQFANGMATRTKFIDEEVEASYEKNLVTQVVSLGAGLDTRPWRLSSSNNRSDYFEVDFKEIFNFKLSLLPDPRTIKQFNYRGTRRLLLHLLSELSAE